MSHDLTSHEWILGIDVPTRRKTLRKRTGIFLDMDQPTTSKASIIHNSSKCENWQEFFELAYECRGTIITAIREIKEKRDANETK